MFDCIVGYSGGRRLLKATESALGKREKDELLCKLNTSIMFHSPDLSHDATHTVTVSASC